MKGTYSEKVRSEESIILKAREDLEELHGGRESSEPAGGKVKTKSREWQVHNVEMWLTYSGHKI